MSTYRYPLDISKSETTYMIFTRAKNIGFTTESLRNVDTANFKSQTVGGIGLPVPRTITDSSGITYTDVQDMSLIAQTLQKGADKVIGSGLQQQGYIATGTNKAIQSMLFISGVGLKSWTFNWKLIPESKDEMNNIEKIIQEFELGKLPEYDTEIMKFPDAFKISFGGVKPKLIRFLPCVITSMEVQYGENEFQLYNDGGHPIINLSITFGEIAGRTQEIQKRLYSN